MSTEMFEVTADHANNNGFATANGEHIPSMNHHRFVKGFRHKKKSWSGNGKAFKTKSKTINGCVRLEGIMRRNLKKFE